MLADLARRPHLWLAGGDGGDAAAASWLPILSPAERSRYESIRPTHVRYEFLLGRALLRSTLSRYTPVAPAAWVFRETARGRLELDAPRDAPALRFNIAHAEGLVACLVTHRAACGVDVEHPRRRLDIGRFAGRFYAPHEAAAVRRAAPADRAALFYSIWTLKEAYLKARGLGISVPLASLSFAIEEERIAARFEPPLADSPSAWSFALFESPSGHRIGVALAGGGRAARDLAARRAIPLVSDSRSERLRRVAAS